MCYQDAKLKRWTHHAAKIPKLYVSILRSIVVPIWMKSLPSGCCVPEICSTTLRMHIGVEILLNFEHTS